MKRSEVSIKTRSAPASLSFTGEATKHTTVNWSLLKNATRTVLVYNGVTKYVTLNLDAHPRMDYF